MSKVLENNATLEGELIGILREVTNTAADAKEFVLSELPDVVSQVIMWYGVYNFIEFLLGLSLLLIVFFTNKKVYYNKTDDETWFQGLNSDEQFVALLPGSFASTIMAGIGILYINLQWLKIWIAPKLWLIEYTASLVK